MYDTESARNCKTVGEEACCPPSGSMTDLLRETSCIASDALLMVQRINSHLFGIGNSVCAEKEAEPRCFHDELAKQKSTLLMTVEELAKICAKLGL